MALSEYIQDCLRRKVIFFTGKGGVGKSSVAWATALACQRQGARVRLASWTPFDAQADASVPSAPMGGSTGVDFVPLETLSAFREYVLRVMRFESVFNAVFENHVLKTFLKAAPGLSETVISGKIWDLYQGNEQDVLVVDLPSSGHALSFFQSPLGVNKLFAAGLVHRESEKICSMFRSPDTRIDLVSLPEELPVVESVQLKTKLQSLTQFHFGYLLLNLCQPDFDLPAALEPARLPEPVRECVSRYLDRRQQEQEAMAMAAEVELQAVKIPRFTDDTIEGTLRSVAVHLETAPSIRLESALPRSEREVPPPPQPGARP